MLHQAPGGIPGLSIPIFNILQMSKNKTQFIINLVKLPNGYAYDSLDEPQLAPSKKKNPPKTKTKNSTSRISNNRILKELALDSQPPPEPLVSIQQQPEIPRRLPLPEPEEQISVQIKRQTGLPDCPATWFNESTVHDLQKLALPEFFRESGYKSPDLYMKYRNFMVAAYRRNPNQYLTKIACRRVLRGDVSTIMKVHSFLEKVGLINFGISKDGDYSFVPSIFSKAINSQPKAPIGIEKMPEADDEKTIQPVDIPNITHTYVNKCFSKSNRAFCSKCHSLSGIVWYQRKGDSTQDDTAICLQCYQNLSGSQSERFIRTDIIKRIQNGIPKESKPVTWSFEDNMNLLGFVGQSNNSWDPLQKQTFQNKKSFDDIMLQFMQFPIANFDHTQQAPIGSHLSYQPTEYVKRLIKRYRESPYQTSGQSMVEEANQGPKGYNHQFFEGFSKVINRVHEKYETKINYLTNIEDSIENSLFEIKLMKEPKRKDLGIKQMGSVRLSSVRESESDEGDDSDISKNDADYEGGGQENEEDQVLDEFNFNYS